MFTESVFVWVKEDSREVWYQKIPKDYHQEQQAWRAQWEPEVMQKQWDRNNLQTRYSTRKDQ